MTTQQTIIERATYLRGVIEGMAQELDDADALDVPELFPNWSPESVDYVADERVRYGGVLYACLTAHTSQPSWTPADAPSLWARVLIPDPDVIPEWEQPESTNAYAKGDKVRHNGVVWVSDVDNNIWEPGVYGWTQLLE